MKTVWVSVVLMNTQLIAEESKRSIEEIIKKSYQAFYYAGDDGQAKARMLIVDKQGNKQIRQFNIFRKDIKEGGDQNFLVVFEKPSDIKGTVLLVNKHSESEDDRWLYLPGLDLEKRISSSDKRTSFVGSNYFYEDISGRNYKLDDYELISEDDDYYRVKATPKSLDGVEFSHYELTIEKDSFMPRVISYFKGVKLYRKAEILELKDVDGYATVFKSKITDFETGSSTLVQFRKPDYDVGLKDTLFSARSLRNPPKGLK